MRLFLFTLLLIVALPISASSHRSPEERIAALETEVGSVKASLSRIETKLDNLDEELDEASKTNDSAIPDRTLELLLLLVVGADKAAYWRKRRNGTWSKTRSEPSPVDGS